MKKGILYSICVLALLVCAAAFFLYQHYFSPIAVPLSTHAPGESSRLAIQAATHVRDSLMARHDWVEASRSVLGNSREVLAKLAENNPDEAVRSYDGVTRGAVEKGYTLGRLLGEVCNGAVDDYVNAVARVFPLRSFRAGQPYVVHTDPANGKLKRFEYEINDNKRLVVEGDVKPKARLEDIEYVTLLEKVEGVIDDNLFQSVSDIGENPHLAMRLVDLFGSEINFIKDIRSGDKFSALIEKRYREGEYRGYGRILAATFSSKGKNFEAFLFRDGEGRLQNYNSKGENLKKTLLMAPLAVTRLTSKFSHNRKHPILGHSRPHHGVDYGAPTGTPVKAVGEGVVTQRGWAGGFGNQIIIRHSAGLESMYAHLSGFAKGIANGKSVRQGQTIGFVGSTGLSTGPHLDFRLRQNGKFINPVKAVNPRGAPVESRHMAEFQKTKALAQKYLAGAPLPTDYKLDSIIPLALSSPQGHVKSKEVKKASQNNRRQAEKIVKKKTGKTIKHSARASSGKSSKKTGKS